MSVKVKFNETAIAELVKVGESHVAKVGEEVAVEAKRLAPSKSGRLAASIHRVVEEGGRVSVVADAPYALYQELGTRNMPAQPFLRPAIDVVAGRDK